jgi:hypothetical protein
MACYNSCCPTPCRYRRTVVVATNTCSPCGGSGYGFPFAGGYGAGCGVGCGAGAVFPSFNPVYTNCGWANSGAFGWGVVPQGYGPF